MSTFIITENSATTQQQTQQDVNNLSAEVPASISTRDLICWSFQVARGMEYLVSKKVIAIL